MKKYITAAMMLFALFASAQQVSLFDKSGQAVAYIDYDKDDIIFLWDGTPVAFLEKDGIVGFNRQFLGWYQNGIIYNRKGYIVGCKKDAISMYYKIESMKSIQKMPPIKPVTPIAPLSPIRSMSWSPVVLRDWLLKGK